MAEIIPGANIVAVSYGKPKDEVKNALGSRLEYRNEDLMGFLKSNRQPFDLVHIARAGNIVGLETAKDYEVLKRNVTPGGYVVTVFDTMLDPAHMSIYFTPIAIPRHSDTIAVWQG